MTKVNVSKKIQVPASPAWKNLSSFRGIEEISPIERSVTNGHGKGATRTCYMPDGAEIHEILSEMSEANMKMEYKITDGPFPIDGYVSTIQVKASGPSACEVTWGCQFKTSKEAEPDMVNLFTGFYNVIIDNLEGKLKGKVN